MDHLDPVKNIVQKKRSARRSSGHWTHASKANRSGNDADVPPGFPPKYVGNMISAYECQHLSNQCSSADTSDHGAVEKILLLSKLYEKDDIEGSIGGLKEDFEDANRIGRSRLSRDKANLSGTQDEHNDSSMTNVQELEQRINKLEVEFEQRIEILQRETTKLMKARPICDRNLYFPSRLFEADVTTTYARWWKQSVLDHLDPVKNIVQQKRSARRSSSRWTHASKANRSSNDAGVPPGFPPKYVSNMISASTSDHGSVEKILLLSKLYEKDNIEGSLGGLEDDFEDANWSEGSRLSTDKASLSGTQDEDHSDSSETNIEELEQRINKLEAEFEQRIEKLQRETTQLIKTRWKIMEGGEKGRKMQWMALSKVYLLMNLMVLIWLS
ncbi:hypothetical protein TanjilG_07413 [Lupinus angustifolius]|uniref:Uncharacterized protein n=1 Tax=Lupinus angustifolius TaxID=3871 RepID=A0A394DAP2_LUPAN|nr:hypothetical protein TanjilG_07413 [Lupinus angustifolius]